MNSTVLSPVGGTTSDALYLEFFKGAGSQVFLTGVSGASSVPEPASFILCGLGALGLFIAARRRRKA